MVLVGVGRCVNQDHMRFHCGDQSLHDLDRRPEGNPCIRQTSLDQIGTKGLSGLASLLLPQTRVTPGTPVTKYADNGLGTLIRRPQQEASASQLTIIRVSCHHNDAQTINSQTSAGHTTHGCLHWTTKPYTSTRSPAVW